jgi:hypothetical protein
MAGSVCGEGIRFRRRFFGGDSSEQLRISNVCLVGAGAGGFFQCVAEALVSTVSLAEANSGLCFGDFMSEAAGGAERALAAFGGDVHDVELYA